MSEQYSSQVIRNPYLEDGPGFETLYLGDRAVASWPIVTGHKELDPKAYGGLTPPIRVVMDGPIHEHQEPNYHVINQDHCVLLPYEEDKDLAASEYPNRTWYRDGDRFKRHKIGWGKGGRSSGCLSTPDWYWDYCKTWLNKAYEHSQQGGYQFITDVCDFWNA